MKTSKFAPYNKTNYILIIYITMKESRPIELRYLGDKDEVNGE